MKELISHQNFPNLKNVECQNLFYMKRYFLHHNPELAKPNFLSPKPVSLKIIHKKSSEKAATGRRLGVPQNATISNSYIKKMCLQFEKYLSILEKTDKLQSSCQLGALLASSNCPISLDKNNLSNCL